MISSSILSGIRIHSNKFKEIIAPYSRKKIGKIEILNSLTKKQIKQLLLMPLDSRAKMAANPYRAYKDAIYEQFERIGKALSCAKRLELLDLICQGPRTVEALAQEASLSIANTSKHLQALRAARAGPARSCRPRGLCR